MVTYFQVREQATRPIDKSQINGSNKVSMLPDKKLIDFLRHEIEFSIVKAFHAIKNITSNPRSGKGHSCHRAEADSSK